MTAEALWVTSHSANREASKRGTERRIAEGAIPHISPDALASPA